MDTGRQLAEMRADYLAYQADVDAYLQRRQESRATGQKEMEATGTRRPAGVFSPTPRTPSTARASCSFELFKHKERIARATHLSEEGVLECLHELLARIQFVEEGSIPIGTWMEARRLCRDVDLKDSPFVALTLHLDGLLWSGDEELKARSFRKRANASRYAASAPSYSSLL